MKKGIFAFLAMLTVFSMIMVSCGGGGGGSSKSSGIAITFDLNYEDAPKATVLKVAKGKSLGEKFPATPVREEKDDAGAVIALYPFTEWNSEADGSGEKITSATEFAEKTTVYAQWGRPYNPQTTVIVNFYTNDGTSDIYAGPFYVKKGAVFATPVEATDPSNEWPDDPEREDYEFIGWSIKADSPVAIPDADKYTASTVNTANTDVYAIWKPAPKVDVSFDLNFQGAPVNKVSVVVGKTIGATNFPATPTMPGYTFSKWTIKADGTGGEFKNDTVVDEAITVYAQWIKNAPIFTPPTYDPLAKDAIVEKVTLSNGWTAIYELKLPEGKTWEDYEPVVTVDYQLADVTTEVRARAMGNFTAGELDEAVFGMYNGTNVAVVASWPGGKTGAWIWNNKFPGMGAPATLFGASATPTPANNSWFTVTYKVDGTDAHGQWNNHINNAPEAGSAAIIGREPVPTDEGSFYIGVGLTSNSKDAVITSQIRNVTLKGLTEAGTTDIIGMPLYFKNTSGALFRVFNGQLEDPIADTDTNGNGGLCANFQDGAPYSEIISGNDKIVPINLTTATDVPTPTTVTVTFNANFDSDDDDFADMPEDTEFIVYKGTGKVPAAKLTAAAREGYFFLGYFMNAAGTGGKVTSTQTFAADTTIYAKWIEDDGVDADPVVIDSAAELRTMVEAKGGAPAKTTTGDLADFVVMADGTWNDENGTSDNDSLLSFEFPADLNPKLNTIKITYEFKAIETPTVTGTQVADAAAILKNGYNSWTTISKPNYGAYITINPAGATLTEDLNYFSDGVSIQINKSNDGDKIRVGYVYGIKITKIEFTQE